MFRAGRSLAERIVQLVKDDRGGEVLEYALIAGLIVAGAVVTIKVFGQFAAWGWGQIASRL